MFTQKEDHLQEGNMLIHSWYCLGRGTPHQPGSGVTCFPRGMEWGTGGKLQKACPPLHSCLETLKSQILSCSYTNPSEIEAHRRLCVDISIHYPVPGAGSSRPHLSHTLARPQSGELPPHPPHPVCRQLDQLCLPPPEPRSYQKGPERMSQVLGLLPSRSYFCCCCCSIAQSCPTLYDPMDCSMPGFPVLHQFLELAQTCPLSQWCHPTISSSVIPFSSCLQSFPASGPFLMSRLFAPGGQSIGASTSASVLPKTTEGCISFRIDWWYYCTFFFLFSFFSLKHREFWEDKCQVPISL